MDPDADADAESYDSHNPFDTQDEPSALEKSDKKGSGHTGAGAGGKDRMLLDLIMQTNKVVLFSFKINRMSRFWQSRCKTSKVKSGKSWRTSRQRIGSWK